MTLIYYITSKSRYYSSYSFNYEQQRNIHLNRMFTVSKLEEKELHILYKELDTVDHLIKQLEMDGRVNIAVFK